MAEMLSRIHYEAQDRPTYAVRESFENAILEGRSRAVTGLPGTAMRMAG